ncbi:hypothetical protein SAMN05192566_0154 [Methylophilus rhizosphaerae]|uniref:Uncharacterized protein n=1 Tax=Methylophilus rhizosphaerae TaxID=492660 RepID=A0A1G8ZAC5_9PROT|nr:hypothetical protein [Methylophilus rhizosphaerae]SDK11365.1 hypothetical protein SAMN05192566_0154 [Methylophilus rhizosphaerae]
MSLSTIQANIAAILNKAYGADTGTVAASTDTSNETKPVSNDNNETASASTEVTLGEGGNTTEIYTAQGLLQQMRQIQLSNTQLLFGSNGDSSDDNNSLFGLSGNAGSDGLESASQDWVQSISQNPGKAAVMVESAKNTSLTTILGN